MSLTRQSAIMYRQKLFRDDCARRNLKTWRDRKQYAQSDKLWSQLIVWRSLSDKGPQDKDYCEMPIFVLEVKSSKK